MTSALTNFKSLNIIKIHVSLFLPFVSVTFKIIISCCQAPYFNRHHIHSKSRTDYGFLNIIVLISSTLGSMNWFGSPSLNLILPLLDLNGASYLGFSMLRPLLLFAVFYWEAEFNNVIKIQSIFNYNIVLYDTYTGANFGYIIIFSEIIT